MKYRINLKHYTLMMIRDPKQSVLRLRIPAFLLIAAPLLFVLACGFAYVSFLSSMSFDRTNKELQDLLTGQHQEHLSEVSNKNQTIEHLEQQLLQLSQQADEIDARMEEIQQLEEEMKRLTGLDTTSSDTAVAAAENSHNHELTGIGGSSREMTLQDADALVADTKTHYESLYNQIATLYGDLSLTKEKVLEQQEILDHTPTIWPVDSRVITSVFGVRQDPFTFKMSYHSGLDIGAQKGAPAYAGASGTVASTGSDPYHGNNIIIDHGNGLKTWYMHLSEIGVVKGEQVKKGQIIGKVGSTGRSTGPHLHYEILQNGTSIDPKPYLNESRKEE